jgi:hypothetical protein
MVPDIYRHTPYTRAVILYCSGSLFLLSPHTRVVFMAPILKAPDYHIRRLQSFTFSAASTSVEDLPGPAAHLLSQYHTPSQVPYSSLTSSSTTRKTYPPTQGISGTPNKSSVSVWTVDLNKTYLLFTLVIVRAQYSNLSNYLFCADPDPRSVRINAASKQKVNKLKIFNSL